MAENWKKTLRRLWQKEKWYWLGAVLLGLCMTALFTAYWSKGYAEQIQNGIAEKVVRFHVLANSDSAADQTLKLEVRDRVLAEYGALLGECDSKAESLAALADAQQAISETALACVQEAGYDYPVRVSLVQEAFPQKEYDTLTFPAGIYDALRIEIGAGAGQNWWCVCYPEMCFVDAAWGHTTPESQRRLEHTLTEEEFLVVSAREQAELTPKIKLKLVEWWQGRA